LDELDEEEVIQVEELSYNLVLIVILTLGKVFPKLYSVVFKV